MKKKQYKFKIFLFILALLFGSGLFVFNAHPVSAQSWTPVSSTNVPSSITSKYPVNPTTTYYRDNTTGNWRVSQGPTTAGLEAVTTQTYLDADGKVVDAKSTGTGGVEVGSKQTGILESAIAKGIITIISWITYAFTYAAGYLLTFIIQTFSEIIQYNNFVNVQTVVTGWVIIRDLCNMFFVLMLLIIAFATILRIETYSVNKMLPKLVIMAILINFSRTIFGLVIDFGQVLMLTFVAGFSEFGANELVRIFQINEYLSTSKTIDAIGGLATLSALIMGSLAMLVTLVVMFVFLAIIVMRIIMLWIYTILSPLVFFGRAFPAAEKYTEQIWGDFIKQVITGPLLAFFLWLALSTAQPSAESLRSNFNLGSTNLQNSQSTEISGSLNSLFQADNFQRYIIVIGLLIGGLMVTQQMGGAAASIAGKGMNFIQKGKGLATGLGKAAGKGAALKTWGGLKKSTKATGRLGLAVAGTADRWLGKKVDVASGKMLKGWTPGLGNKGVVGKTGAGIVNLKENAGAFISKKLNKNRDVNTALRNFNQDEKLKGKDARLSYNGKTYEKQTNGTFVNVDDATDLLKKADGKEAKQMSDMAASWLDAWNGAQSEQRAIKNKEQDEAINKESQKIVDSNMSSGEMLRKLHDATTSNSEKMALAMTLAIKEGFKDSNDVKRAKNVLGSNSILLNKFEDTVDKKQAHLNYDLSTVDDKRKFSERIEDGKIDPSKLDKSAYSNKHTIEAIAEYAGDEFGDVMKTIAKRSKKYKEEAAKGLKENIGSVVDVDGNPNKYAKNYAKITGDLVGAFTDREASSSTKGKINSDALVKYITNAKAAEIAKIDKDLFDLAKLSVKMAEHGNTDAPLTVLTKMEEAIGQNVTYAKLKSMYKTDESEDLIKKVYGMMNSQSNNGHIAAQDNIIKIAGDKELMSIVK